MRNPLSAHPIPFRLELHTSYPPRAQYWSHHLDSHSTFPLPSHARKLDKVSAMENDTTWRVYQIDNDRRADFARKLGNRLIYLVNDNPLAIQHDFVHAGDPYRRYTPFPLVLKEELIKSFSPEKVVHKGYLQEKDRWRWVEIVKAVLKEGPRQLGSKALVEKVWQKLDKEKLLVK